MIKKHLNFLNSLVCRSQKVNNMAKKSMIAKAARTPKFQVRAYTRCQICGRPHSVYKDFGICRICLRKMANEGLIPGLKKASW